MRLSDQIRGTRTAAPKRLGAIMKMPHAAPRTLGPMQHARPSAPKWYGLMFLKTRFRYFTLSLKELVPFRAASPSARAPSSSSSGASASASG